MIECEDQAEAGELWSKLSTGSEGACGWLKDKYGLSWQIAPRDVIQRYIGSDTDASARAMQAMMKMKKLDIAALRPAHEGKGAQAGTCQAPGSSASRRSTCAAGLFHLVAQPLDAIAGLVFFHQGAEQRLGFW